MTEPVGYVFFSHPIQTYGQPETLEVLRALQRQYKGYKILDPEDVDIDRAGWVTCQVCMRDRMKKLFFPLIEKCDIFALWAPIASCGIECELHKAWELSKLLTYISYAYGEVNFEDMTLQDYHYMRVATEVI